ncbi:hypothetical protein [Bacillus cereus]
MKKILRGLYTSLTVSTDIQLGVATIEVKDYGEYTFDIRPEEIDELIKTLQEAKEVLARGRNTNE